MSLQVKKINSNPVGRTVLAVAIAGTAAALSGCNVANTLDARETLTQGYVIDEQALELVPVGSSREQVLLALGSPSTTATFDNEAFYYISQKRVRGAAFMRPRLVEQKVLAVYFGDDERVSKIANYGLEDGKVFDFISRTTPTGGKEQTFIGQILAGASKGGPPSGLFGGGGG
ncbi:outer membrane protein assembly factor BamE [uncultured Nitratireductor sp.]|uniref:outer membrane protein assembly factor BamE n=1 Tax=uncultured Nitratireductor sp. TaxID=520953 RepID=UPI0025D37B60|nr:outer membrane protein assembly factor BamE [uncultured Nitratireductor sp.]